MPSNIINNFFCFLDSNSTCMYWNIRYWPSSDRCTEIYKTNIQECVIVGHYLDMCGNVKGYIVNS